MRRYFALFLVLGLATTLSYAQESQPSSSSAQQAASGDSKSEKQEKQDKKDKKKKEKKDKKDKGQQDELNTEMFSQAIANNVLNDLRDGLEGHSQRLMLSAFDQDKMDGYLSFEDQIQAMFAKYDSFRVHYRISNSTIEGSKGVVLVDFEMEEIPRGGGNPQRRNGQIRFEMERNRKGWKIVDFTPRGFFS